MGVISQLDLQFRSDLYEILYAELTGRIVDKKLSKTILRLVDSIVEKANGMYDVK